MLKTFQLVKSFNRTLPILTFFCSEKNPFDDIKQSLYYKPKITV